MTTEAVTICPSAPVALLIGNSTQMFTTAESGACAAVVLGSLPLLRMCLDAGANATTRDVDGRSLLLTASRYGHAACVALLLERGALRVVPSATLCDMPRDPPAATSSSQPPLHVAARNAHLPVIWLLLGAGCSPQETDAVGNTALHAAAVGVAAAPCEEQRLDLIKTLMHAGFDVGVRNALGATARDLLPPGARGNMCRLLFDGASAALRCATTGVLFAGAAARGAAAISNCGVLTRGAEERLADDGGHGGEEDADGDDDDDGDGGDVDDSVLRFRCAATGRFFSEEASVAATVRVLGCDVLVPTRYGADVWYAVREATDALTAALVPWMASATACRVLGDVDEDGILCDDASTSREDQDTAIKRAPRGSTASVIIAVEGCAPVVVAPRGDPSAALDGRHGDRRFSVERATIVEAPDEEDDDDNDDDEDDDNDNDDDDAHIDRTSGFEARVDNAVASAGTAAPLRAVAVVPSAGTTATADARNAELRFGKEDIVTLKAAVNAARDLHADQPLVAEGISMLRRIEAAASICAALLCVADARLSVPKQELLQSSYVMALECAVVDAVDAGVSPLVLDVAAAALALLAAEHTLRCAIGEDASAGGISTSPSATTSARRHAECSGDIAALESALLAVRVAESAATAAAAAAAAVAQQRGRIGASHSDVGSGQCGNNGVDNVVDSSSAAGFQSDIDSGLRVSTQSALPIFVTKGNAMDEVPCFIPSTPSALQQVSPCTPIVFAPVDAILCGVAARLVRLRYASDAADAAVAAVRAASLQLSAARADADAAGSAYAPLSYARPVLSMEDAAAVKAAIADAAAAAAVTAAVVVTAVNTAAASPSTTRTTTTKRLSGAAQGVAQAAPR